MFHPHSYLIQSRSGPPIYKVTINLSAYDVRARIAGMTWFKATRATCGFSRAEGVGFPALNKAYRLTNSEVDWILVIPLN
jgi:hypothetical protein